MDINYFLGRHVPYSGLASFQELYYCCSQLLYSVAIMIGIAIHVRFLSFQVSVSN